MHEIENSFLKTIINHNRNMNPVSSGFEKVTIPQILLKQRPFSAVA